MNTPPCATFVDTGSLVFLSGQTASDNLGIVRGDTEAQTFRCLESMENRLSDAGLSRAQLVECTIWLCHQADISAFNAAYAAYFGPHEPAHSVVIGRLGVTGALVEIEAIARREMQACIRSTPLLHQRPASGTTSGLNKGRALE